MNETELSQMYHYSIWAVFFAVFVSMLVLKVRPTRRTSETDIPRWKRYWNGVEVVLLVAFIAGIVTAVPDAANRFAEEVAHHNQALAHRERVRAHKNASDYADYRCERPEPEVLRICRTYRQVIAMNDTDANVWNRFSEALAIEREAAIANGLSPNDWAVDEATNVADAASRVSGFAATRDRWKKVNVTSPVPWQVLMIWPHLIAIGFALSLAKAVAARSLL